MEPADLLVVPDIKVNDLDGPVTVSASDTLSITVDLQPGPHAGLHADWWCVVRADFPHSNEWYSYVHPTGWEPGIWRAHEGPIFHLPPFQVWNDPLPEGDYTFYWGVDNNTDNLPDGTWLDTVEVHVTP